MLTFTAYIVLAYIALPLLYTTTTSVVKHITHNPKICPLIQCFPPLLSCLREVECKQWIDQIQECTHPDSDARQKSAERFSHVQFPNDAAYCTYLAFDMLTTSTALTFLECIGKSGCLEKATHSDMCATEKELSNALPFETVPSSVWEGQWRKLYSTGWDLWPCQWTLFSPPQSDDDEDGDDGTKKKKTLQPEVWMKNWPHVDNIWRMDLKWKNSVVTSSSDGVEEDGGADSSVTFQMSNEMYPAQTWDFSNIPPNHEIYSISTPKSTLKTRAVMWGTEAHENWYLLHYDAEMQIMLIYYCAHTAAVDRFDSMTMVLQKKNNDYGSKADEVTEEYRVKYEQMVTEMLGPVHGKLQRIPDCQ